MNLLLISPLTSKSLLGADFYFRMPTLGLLRVAGATPPEWTWSNYNTNNVVYRPEGMTAEQLFDGSFALQKAVYTVPAIVRRLWGTTSRANF